jgi:hypothetical protein
MFPHPLSTVYTNKQIHVTIYRKVAEGGHKHGNQGLLQQQRSPNFRGCWDGWLKGDGWLTWYSAPACYGSSLGSNPEPVFVNVDGAQESIPPAYVAWRAGTTYRVVVPARKAGNRFLGSFKGLQIRLRHPSKLQNGHKQKSGQHTLALLPSLHLS